MGDGAYTNATTIRPLRKRGRIFIGRLRSDVAFAENAEYAESVGFTGGMSF